jgi:hypothetical protein
VLEVVERQAASSSWRRSHPGGRALSASAVAATLASSTTAHDVARQAERSPFVRVFCIAMATARSKTVRR